MTQISEVDQKISEENRGGVTEVEVEVQPVEVKVRKDSLDIQPTQLKSIVRDQRGKIQAKDSKIQKLQTHVVDQQKRIQKDKGLMKVISKLKIQIATKQKELANKIN